MIKPIKIGPRPTKLQDLVQKVKDAAVAVEKELERLYPRGSKWGVLFRHGQVNPTPATVLGYEGGVYPRVTVEFEQVRDAYGQLRPRRRIRDFSPRNIVPLA